MGSEPKKTMWFVVVADRDVSKMGSEQRELEKFKVQGSTFNFFMFKIMGS